MENADFEVYYKAQKIVPEEQWEQFLARLREPLPTNFRVSHIAPNRHILVDRIKKELAPSEDDVRAAVDVVESESGLSSATDKIAGRQPMASANNKVVPFQLPWYPEGLAWQLDLPRRFLKRLSPLSPLLDVVVRCTAGGTMSRSEAVSMIPPIVLKVAPHHRVLDMCAAPGSKTGQLLEALQTAELECDETGKPLQPRGVVIANEVESRRAYLLSSQTDRVGSPGLIVVTHDARRFPDLSTLTWTGKRGEDAGISPEMEGRIYGRPELGGVPTPDGTGITGPKTDGTFFDKVLADVPCSGDGTARKNVSVWKQFQITMGMNLHPLQLQIACRGLQVLREGGEMVYSTCTFNPIENEAIVAALLRWAGGSLEIVEPRDRVPSLACRPGLTSWVVMDRNRGEWASIADVERALLEKHRHRLRARVRQIKEAHAAGVPVPTEVPEGSDTTGVGGTDLGTGTLKKMSTTFFPPSPEEAVTMGLEKCIRMLPHDGNTGGFFVCLLRKTGPVPRVLPDMASYFPFSHNEGVFPLDPEMAELQEFISEHMPKAASSQAKRERPPSSAEVEPQPKSTRLTVDDDDDETVTAAAAASSSSAAVEASEAVVDGSVDVVEASEDAGDSSAPKRAAPSRRQRREKKKKEIHPWVGKVQHTSLLPLWDPTSNMQLFSRTPHIVTDTLAEDYGLPASFPRDCIFTRNGNLLSLYFHTDQAANAVLSPIEDTTIHVKATFDRLATKVKIVSAGVKLAEARSHVKASKTVITDAASVRELGYRFTADGTHLVAMHATKLVASLSGEEIAQILMTGRASDSRALVTELPADLVERLVMTVTGGSADREVAFRRNSPSIILRLDEAMVERKAWEAGAPAELAELAHPSVRAHFISRTAFSVRLEGGAVILHVRGAVLEVIVQSLAERHLGPVVEFSRSEALPDDDDN
jgi:16S rRNA C967 or C1407 C5-methylase (RsmB/RsmF family)